MRQFAPSVLAVLLFGTPAAAGDVVFDDGGDHVLDSSLAPLQPDPYGSTIEVYDGPGSDPTSLELATDQDLWLKFEAYGSSTLRLTSVGDARIQAYHQSTVIVEEGSLDCCSQGSRVSAHDDAIVHVREQVYHVGVDDDSQVFFESGFTTASSFQAELNSTTVMLTGEIEDGYVLGNAEVSVLGGIFGADLYRHHGHVVIDGGALWSDTDVLLWDFATLDVHSNTGAPAAPSGTLTVTDYTVVQLFGTNFTLDGVPVFGELSAGVQPLEGTLAGTLESGDAVSWDISVQDSGIIRFLPEPGTGLLLALGLAAAARPKSRAALGRSA